MPTRIPPAVRAVPAVRRPATRRAVPRLVPVPAPAPGQPRSAAPDPAEVARLAYSYWEARGCQGGSPEEDWLRAEDELRRSLNG
jgi:hypothetical protein